MYYQRKCIIRERPSRPFSWDRRNLRTLASRTSILDTADKIVVSKMIGQFLKV